MRGWIEEAIASGELVEIPANALASILLALTDGLMLHGALDPGAFRWRNIRRAIDVMLAGIAGRMSTGDHVAVRSRPERHDRRRSHGQRRRRQRRPRISRDVPADGSAAIARLRGWVGAVARALRESTARGTRGMLALRSWSARARGWARSRFAT